MRDFIWLKIAVECTDALLKIDSVMFFVSDLEKAAKFYENVLGLKRVWTDKEQEMIGFIFPESDSEIVIHKDSSMPSPSTSFGEKCSDIL